MIVTIISDYKRYVNIVIALISLENMFLKRLNDFATLLIYMNDKVKLMGTLLVTLKKKLET